MALERCRRFRHRRISAQHAGRVHAQAHWIQRQATWQDSVSAGRRATQQCVDRTRLRLARWLWFDGLQPSDGRFGTVVVAVATAGPRRANWRASLKHPLLPPAKAALLQGFAVKR